MKPLALKLFSMKLSGVALPRMWLSILLSLALGLLVSQAQPHLMSVTLYKFSLVVSAGVAGYYLDLELFPYARPDMFLMEPWTRGTMPVIAPAETIPFVAAQLRRAFIVGTMMLAVGLGA